MELNTNYKLALLAAKIYETSGDAAAEKANKTKKQRQEFKDWTQQAADCPPEMASSTWKTSWASVAISFAAAFAPDQDTANVINAFGQHVPSGLNSRWTSDVQKRQTIASNMAGLTQTEMNNSSQQSSSELTQLAQRVLEQSGQVWATAARG